MVKNTGTPKRGRGRPKGSLSKGGVGKKASDSKAYAPKKNAPRPPKAALKAQDLFVAEHLKTTMAQNPEMSKYAAQRSVLDAWDDMASDEQEEYFTKEREAKAKYQKQLASYERRREKWEKEYGDDDSSDVESDEYVMTKKEKKKKKKRERDPNLPKKGLNPYMFYSQKRAKEIRALDPKVQQKDALRLATAEWKAMSDDQKKPYQDMAAADKARHARELKKYLEDRGEVAPVDEHPKPKKGLNPFMFYSRQRTKEIRALDPNVQQKHALQRATAEWNSMSDEGKKPYQDMAAADKQRHDREYLEWYAKYGAEAVGKKK